MVNVSQPPCTRPPTPPKENIDTDQLPVDHHYQSTLGQHALLDTPDESPSSSCEYFSGSSGKLPKRVVFSPWTSYHKPLILGNKSTILDGNLKSLPPSKECRGSHKSILKVSTDNSSPLFDLTPQLVLDPNETVAIMLRSVTQHLSSASRDSRMDSYRTMLGCLGAYEEVLETQPLVDNLAGFLEYIRRDISAKQTGTGNLDVELGSYALKVLTTILCTPGLSNAVPHEFGTFIAEQAVASMERRETPKVMLDHYMQLLARQKLPQRIINSEKAVRILNALNGIQARVKGNRVIAQKLMIYQRLLVQAKSLMVARAEEWLEFLIASMSSSVKDVRVRAIVFGTDAALALGTTAAVSQSCIDILDRGIPAGQKVVDDLGARMLELLNAGNEGCHAPQVWCIVILFLRSRRHQIERWSHLKGWLLIMERAFNASDPKVKLQANLAWNRFVSAINLDTSTGAPLLRVLRRPIASQMGRRNNENHSKHARQLARSTYCNFLYYAFRPGVTFEQLDLYWHSFVASILPTRSTTTKSDVDFSYDVLSALLSSSQPRVWDQGRAQQAIPVKPEELPCLDPKWIRSRAAKIISVMEGLQLYSNMARTEEILVMPSFKAWQSFMRSLGDAASKEVKASMETMTALAHITSMLYRYWTKSYTEAEDDPRRLDVLVTCTTDAIAKIGFRPFAEKRLLRASPESPFEAAETPSSRSSRPQGDLRSPITCLLHTLVDTAVVREPVEKHYKAIQTFLDIALRTASDRRTRLVILWELAQDIIIGVPANIGSPSKLVFWERLATEAAQSFSLPLAQLSDNGIPLQAGNGYTDAVRLLESGIREFGYDVYPTWKILSDAVLEKIQTEVCQEGILLVYTEPLCKVLHEKEPNEMSDTFLRCCTFLLDRVRWPESRQALERTKRQLWGPMSIPRGPASLDPFNHLYPMVENLLTWTYPVLQSISVDPLTQAVSGINSFLLTCPPSLRTVCLKRLQRGLCVWIEDKDGALSASRATQDLSILRTAVKAMWQIALNMVKLLAKPENSSLSAVSDILAAGFRSRHEFIVNDMIILWNETFGKAESLEYPEVLRLALTRLRTKVQIDLPGFVDSEEGEIQSSPFDFVESQDGQIDVQLEKTLHVTPRIAGQAAEGIGSVYRMDGTPRSPMSKVALPRSRSTPRARLWHNDSQIHFAAVDSSPLLPTMMESQHLTDHQKEVREQQEHRTAAMFPDIRSSPRRSRNTERRPEFVLHKKPTSSRAFDADAEPSPTFAPGDTTMSEFLDSSPTPRSSRRCSPEHGVDEEPASSPSASPLPSLQSKSLVQRVVPTSIEVSQEKPDGLSPANLDLPVETPDRAGKDSNPQNILDVHGVSSPRASTSLQQRTAATDPMITSGPEEFGDAPALVVEQKENSHGNQQDDLAYEILNPGDHENVTLPKPVTPQKATGRRAIMTKVAFPNDDNIVGTEHQPPAQTPFTPSQDEQVREQLLRDLEEASSQADSQTIPRRPSLSTPSKASKKRKADTQDISQRSKSTRPSASFRSCEVVVENRKRDETIDDCIIIDDRPAAGQRKSASPFIKREFSRSEDVNTHSLAVKTPAFKISGRRRTRSMANRESLHSPVLEDPLAPSAPLDRIQTDTAPQGVNAPDEHRRKRRRADEITSTANDRDSDVLYPARTGRRDDKSNDPLLMPSADYPMALDDEQDDMTSSQIERFKDEIPRPQNVPREVQRSGGQDPTSHSNDGDTEPNTPQDEAQQLEESETTHQAAISSGQRILERFEHLLQDVGQATLQPEEKGKMVKLAVEVLKKCG